MEQGEGDITVIARRYEWDIDNLWQSLLKHLDVQPRSVKSRPQLSDALLSLMQQAWLCAATDENSQIRGVHLLMALVGKPSLLKCDGLWPLLSKEMRLLRDHTRSAIVVHRRGQDSNMASLSWEELEQHSQRRENA